MGFLKSYNIILSILGGVLPAIFWLWFWLKEDKKHPEPKFRIIASFVAGMIAVLIVIPIEKYLYQLAGFGITWLTLASWAATEELLKFGAAYLAALRHKDNDEPLDPVIYMISAALGFSALENSFFLARFIESSSLSQSIISGNMRFIGATLLHTVSSATVGVFLALSFYKNKTAKKNYLFTGIILAIILHALFNSFILKEGKTFIVFSAVWISVIAVILVFEKIKSIKKNYLD